MDRTISLLQLPTEILEAIVLNFRVCGSWRTLKTLSQCCHRLHDIAAPHILSSVAIRTPESMNRFIEEAESSHYLTSLVREVQIHYHFLDEKTDDSPEDIEPVFPKLVNLESLVMSSSNFDKSKAMEMQLLCHPQETLSSLRSVVLSFDQGYEWSFSVGPYASLLYHPGLERLTISGAHFQTGTLKLGAPLRSTRLQELTLLNCALEARQLEDMLRFPHQLKHFTMKGEAERYEYGPICDQDRRVYIDTLRPHASSIETLDIDIQYADIDEPIDLSEFSALQSLTISPRMLIGDSQCYELKEASTREWAELLPSTLRHLTFRHDCGVFPLSQMYEAVRDGCIQIRSLNCLLASNWHTDGSFFFDVSELEAVDPAGVLIFRSPDELMSEISPDGVSYSQGFKALGIEFSVVEVPRAEVEAGGYDSCPCPCWTYRHRLYKDGDDYSWW